MLWSRDLQHGSTGRHGQTALLTCRYLQRRLAMGVPLDYTRGPPLIGSRIYSELHEVASDDIFGPSL